MVVLQVGKADDVVGHLVYTVKSDSVGGGFHDGGASSPLDGGGQQALKHRGFHSGARRRVKFVTNTEQNRASQG